jgi:hypothetical protein
MSGNARWMIGLGWGIPVLVALAIVGLRPTVDAAGEHAGGMLLMVLVVPAFLLALALLTGGTVAGLRTWRMARQALGTADRALLVAGLIGALAGWYLVVRALVGAVLLPGGIRSVT